MGLDDCFFTLILNFLDEVKQHHFFLRSLTYDFRNLNVALIRSRLFYILVA